MASFSATSLRSAYSRRSAQPRQPAMIGFRTRGDAGGPIITRAPVARASSSRGWLRSGSITTMLVARPVSASRCSSGIVIESSPVRMVASRTTRARSRSTGWRHTMDAAASAPVSVAAIQITPPACSANGGGSWHPPAGYCGRFPVYAPSSKPATLLSDAPPRHGIMAEAVSTPPISSMVSTVIRLAT